MARGVVGDLRSVIDSLSGAIADALRTRMERDELTALQVGDICEEITDRLDSAMEQPEGETAKQAAMRPLMALWTEANRSCR